MDRIRDVAIALPAGASVRRLETRHDDRGSLTELFRDSWLDGASFPQWNSVVSASRVMRGVHLHLLHTDYAVVLQGRALVGLKDLRPGSPTEGLSAMIELDGSSLMNLVIPPGIAHGYYFSAPTILFYAINRCWVPDEELGCHFNDPALGFKWPDQNPVLSERDRDLPPLAGLLPRIASYVPAS